MKERIKQTECFCYLDLNELSKIKADRGISNTSGSTRSISPHRHDKNHQTMSNNRPSFVRDS